MTAFGSLSSLLDTPSPQEGGRRTLLDSLSSCNQGKNRTNPIDAAAGLTEIFGELNFEERRNLAIRNAEIGSKLDLLNNRKNTESLQLCTERLGSESSDDLDDFMESGSDLAGEKPATSSLRRSISTSALEGKNSRKNLNFPPPISSIANSGRPWICFRSYRQDGRFVLKQFRIPTQEFLRSSREGGRLKLHFVHPEETISEGDDEQGKKAVEEEDKVEEEEDRLEEEEEERGNALGY